MDSAYAIGHGRAVLISEVALYHPGDPAKCLCKGTALVPMADGTQRVCAAALNSFMAECRPRAEETPAGWFWKVGLSPEEWGLAQIFHAEVREIEQRMAFAQRFPITQRGV